MNRRFGKGEHPMIFGLLNSVRELSECPEGCYCDVYSSRTDDLLHIWTTGPYKGHSFDRVKSDTIRCVTKEVYEMHSAGLSWHDAVVKAFMSEWMEEDE